MMFTGKFADEVTLIRLASQLETAIPWFDKRPPLVKRTAAPVVAPA